MDGATPRTGLRRLGFGLLLCGLAACQGGGIAAPADLGPEPAGDLGPGDLGRDLGGSPWDQGPDAADAVSDLAPAPDVQPDLASSADTGPSDLGEPCPAFEPGPCTLAGAGGQLVCWRGRPVCRVEPGALLCGAVLGDGVLAAGVHSLSCPLVVAAEARLSLAPGAALELGPQVVRVRGRLELEQAALREIEARGVEVLGAGQLWAEDSTFICRRCAGEPFVAAAGEARVELRGGALRDAQGRGIGLRLEGSAQASVLGTHFSGLWVGAMAAAEAQLSLSAASFLACGTGVLVADAAHLSLAESEFVGEGFHLWLDPDAAAALGGALAQQRFVGGAPLVLAGALSGVLSLGPELGLEAVRLQGLSVQEGATLRLEGLGLELDGAGVQVGGSLQLERCVVAPYAGSALVFDPGATGRVRDCSLSLGQGSPGPLLDLRDAGLVVERSLLLGWGGGLGLRASGGAAPRAQVTLRDSVFEAFAQGVAVEGSARCELEGCDFVAVPLPICPGSEGC